MNRHAIRRCEYHFFKHSANTANTANTIDEKSKKVTIVANFGGIFPKHDMQIVRILGKLLFGIWYIKRQCNTCGRLLVNDIFVYF